MRPLIVVNIERIGATPFISAILYGTDGQQLDEIIVLFESHSNVFAKIRELTRIYNIHTVELWTSNKELYIDSLKIAGIAGALKHVGDTKDTRRIIDRDINILKDLYDIKPVIPKPKAPFWRRFLYAQIQKLLKLIEGDGKYEF